ncbi:lipoyl(octanoyl) transferase [Phormidesmis priestleyi ULC007]|uniref:Octanoyltransferase n=1 Tax=Phormidesmis priestleyi ULC007 TaxID=1920490 RepID=A0A2T1DL71_9CYAN|nr:lipoyl(octanoyl) transferase LipB [Phormidesmis priestleyi]PSB21222.1 lipoyl(octanoyl) transferase [Phormidesmis priestleyi ULC007]PZO51250.1 MAG: lipoyl(octanoyl) transferase [Phormidesmis priestleyi]
MDFFAPVNSASTRCCLLETKGLVPYLEAWAWQQCLVSDRKLNPKLDDVLILLEHPPVYTLGQGATTEFLKFNLAQTEYELHRIERGGEVTYHCPGQLVGYPILNLQHYRKDLHWYLRQLEEVIIRVLAVYRLEGTRISGLTGVWVAGRKVAAIGIKVSRWITMHGFALNVCPDLEGFDRIVPCGIPDKPVGSLAQFVPDITIEQVRQEVAIAFAEVFGVKLVPTQTGGL